MKAFILMLLPTLAFAQWVSAPLPTNSQLQLYYPSPYADRNWLFGADCAWSWRQDDTQIIYGVCRYYGNGNTNHSQEGWANVDWKFSVSGYVSISATPCNLDGQPFCNLPMSSNVERLIPAR